MDYPVVFIPGLFGSLGDEVIKGTGSFSFGFAENVYRPFIEILNTMGYVEGIDLFICYYNWRRPVLEAVEKYLLPCIDKVKKKTGFDKVILIGHSLGGLLGRAYIYYFDPFSIDKLIMIGTPNLGSINAYYFWSGGKLPYTKIEDNIIYNAIKLGFILYYNIFENKSFIEAWRNMFPVVQDLLPSYSYGDYLFWDEDGIEIAIPIEDMSISNRFLNTLEKSSTINIKLTIISGSGVYTNKTFVVDMKDRGKIKWADGKPIKTYKTSNGDGTVTTLSTIGYLSGNNIILEGNHTDILYKSSEYLSSILERPLVREFKMKRVEKIYIIFAKNCIKINVMTPRHNEISSNAINIRDDRVQVLNLGSDNYWIMVVCDENIKVSLDVKYMDKFNSKVYTTIIRDKGTGSSSRQVGQ